MKKYINSLNLLQNKYQNYIQAEKEKIQLHQGHRYIKIGHDTRAHAGGWQITRSMMAIALSILLVPLAFKKGRKLVDKLWTEGQTGSEKVTLYFIDKADPSATLFFDKKKGMAAVKKDGDLFKNLRGEQRDDEEIFQEALKSASINILPFASARLQENKAIALAVVQKKGEYYKDLSLAMRDDEGILLAAIQNSECNLMQYSSSRLQESRIAALAQVKKNGEHYKELAPALKDDEEILLEALKSSQSNLLEYATERLKESKPVALALVKRKGDYYKDLSSSLKDNEEILLEAMRTSSSNILKYAPQQLQESKKVALAYVRNGLNYKYLTEKMQKDVDVGIKALKCRDLWLSRLEQDQFGMLINCTKEDLQILREVFELLHPKLKNNAEIRSVYKKRKKAFKNYLKRFEKPVQSPIITNIHQPFYQSVPIVFPAPIIGPIYSPRNFHRPVGIRRAYR